MKISALENQRYYNVTFDNVKVSDGFGVVSGSTILKPLMPTPYSQLIDKLKTHFSVDSDNNQSAMQQYRNHMTALNGFLTLCGKSVESNVGSEFASQFEAKLNAYVSNLKVAPRTIKDRAVQLKTIKRIFELTSPLASARPIGTLAETLRKRLAESGFPPKRVAKEAAVDPGTLYRWLAGATPRADTIPALRRLEMRLGFPREALVSLVKAPTENAAVIMNKPTFRGRLEELKKQRYTFHWQNYPYHSWASGSLCLITR